MYRLRQLLILVLIFGLPSSHVFGEEKVATFAGGCFWCMEPPYDKLDGVIKTVSGYTGGTLEDPSYEQVSSGTTRHVEVVQVTYNDNKVSYEELLDVFWVNIDPYDDAGQFCDKGPQYRAGIFYHDDEQKRLAKASKQQVIANKAVDDPVVTFIKPLTTFYPAEKYHQNYYQKNSLRYKFYRTTCGRDGRLEEVWGERAPD